MIVDYLENVGFGSKAEVTGLNWDVRFTPESGHYSDIAPCPLCAKSGHSNKPTAINRRPNRTNGCTNVCARIPRDRSSGGSHNFVAA